MKKINDLRTIFKTGNRVKLKKSVSGYDFIIHKGTLGVVKSVNKDYIRVKFGKNDIERITGQSAEEEWKNTLTMLAKYGLIFEVGLEDDDAQNINNIKINHSLL